MSQVRLGLALGKPGRELVPLRRWARSVRAGGHAGLLLELQVLEALALGAVGRIQEALSAVDAALGQARAEAWGRLFLDEGEPMTRLLERAAHRRSPTAAYGRGLLAIASGRAGSGAPSAASRAARAQALLEPLREREREALSLIAEGMSNAEIADRLLVRLATVKTHINNLYAKLGARSRTDAVARAGGWRSCSRAGGRGDPRPVDRSPHAGHEPILDLSDIA